MRWDHKLRIYSIRSNTPCTCASDDFVCRVWLRSVLIPWCSSMHERVWACVWLPQIIALRHLFETTSSSQAVFRIFSDLSWKRLPQKILFGFVNRGMDETFVIPCMHVEVQQEVCILLLNKVLACWQRSRWFVVEMRMLYPRRINPVILCG